ncbi:hypothetical protein PIB30_076751, partial [Stylosanthes scabra]|nr:hypothetical protein [Stylosanthes scabra]
IDTPLHCGILLDTIRYTCRDLGFYKIRPSISFFERLIGGLNLFPKGSIRKTESDTHPVAGKIVEKNLIFPYNLDASSSSGPSIQDLGHHASYYGIPCSKAAR